jgi:hypothetical protein
MFEEFHHHLAGCEVRALRKVFVGIVKCGLDDGKLLANGKHWKGRKDGKGMACLGLWLGALSPSVNFYPLQFFPSNWRMA